MEINSFLTPIILVLIIVVLLLFWMLRILSKDLRESEKLNRKITKEKAKILNKLNGIN